MNLPQLKERILRYIWAEAENFLASQVRSGHDGLGPSKYAPTEADLLSIRNIRKHCLFFSFSTLLLLFLATIPLWSQLPRLILAEGRFYIGLFVVGLYFLSHFAIRKPLKQLIKKYSSDEPSAYKKYFRTLGVHALFAIPVAWALGRLCGYPFWMYVNYFGFFLAVYLSVILLTYLHMRQIENSPH